MVYAYVLRAVEGQLNLLKGIEYGATGYAEMCNVARRVREVDRFDGIVNCADNRDFNIQYLHVVLAERYRSLRRMLKGQTVYDDDLEWALDWCAKAEGNQWVYMDVEGAKPKSYRQIYKGMDYKGDSYTVHIPTTANAYRAYQGLFSGSRGTSFENTTLNLAYYRFAEDYVREVFGLESADGVESNYGDDVFSSNTYPGWSALMTWALTNSGLEFQPSKQKVGAVGEFLRV